MNEAQHLKQVFGAALSHHQAGRLAEAEQLYRQILSKNPRQPEVLHMLGVLAHQSGHNEPAEELIRQAIAIQPTVAGYHGNLGMVLAAQKKLNDAIDCYRRAVTLQPGYAEGFKNLSSILLDAERPDEAVEAARNALELNPDFAEAHFNLGAALRSKGDLPAAAIAFSAAVQARPDYAEALNALGDMLSKQGQVEPAIAAFQKAIACRPGYPEAYNNLGNTLRDANRNGDAFEAYRAGLSARPDDAVILNNLATLLEGAPDTAEKCIDVYQRALSVQPNLAIARYNLANALQKLGRLDEAIDQYRQVNATESNKLGTDNLLYLIHFHPEFGPAEIAAEHRWWNDQYIHPLASHRKPHSTIPSPDRPLRIGYVSPDFREHPIGRFMAPLLAHHDHDHFQIFCYSDVKQPTALTRTLEAHASVWHDTRKRSDADLASLIRSDGIDILVDLTMHMQDNRMYVFAQKPAPVQATYLAYCSTTGSEAIDYRLTDAYLDPPELGDDVYVEKPIRLKSYWCYFEPDDAPPPGAAPSIANGYVTFGCLNNFSKVSPGAFRAWCEILRSIPSSRFILHTLAGSYHNSVLARFAESGIDPIRIELPGFLPSADYFKTYNRIDVALDPFPYPGGTTTFDALWMGVPIVSLAGKTSVSRAGLSILTNLGFGEWVARDVDRYIDIARSLAASDSLRQELRTSLRSRLRDSVLMDANRFARDVESAYRTMWRAWCAAME